MTPWLTGQGMVEYSIIVAFVLVATMGRQVANLLSSLVSRFGP